MNSQFIQPLHTPQDRLEPLDLPRPIPPLQLLPLPQPRALHLPQLLVLGLFSRHLLDQPCQFPQYEPLERQFREKLEVSAIYRKGSS